MSNLTNLDRRKHRGPFRILFINMTAFLDRLLGRRR